jgi:superfamily II DNA or RNA helicase
MLLVDELQGSTGDKIQEVISSISPIRMFGYTATNSGLFSKADKVLTGFFGEPLVDIDYPTALKMGAVVPCVVYFVKMPKTDNPTDEGDIGRAIREGIMKNKIRNNLIGKICKAVPHGWQTLIFIDQIKQHLRNLLNFLPEGTKCVHRNSDKEDIKEFALSPKDQARNIQDFVDNKFQYLCSSDVLRAGFDSVNCRVVVQATGGSSVIEVIQEALRGSRVLPEERRLELGVTPKTHFVLIDIWDSHNSKLEAMSEKRREYYLKQGWIVKTVDKVEDINWNKYD